MLNEKEIKKLAYDFVKSVGEFLQQEYKKEDGRWALFSYRVFQRFLTDEEVAWHTGRNHAPFVENGIEKDDPRWFDAP